MIHLRHSRQQLRGQVSKAYQKLDQESELIFNLLGLLAQPSIKDAMRNAIRLASLIFERTGLLVPEAFVGSIIRHFVQIESRSPALREGVSAFKNRNDLRHLPNVSWDAPSQAPKSKDQNDRHGILNAAVARCRDDDNVSRSPAAVNELTEQAFPQLPPPSYAWDTHSSAQFGQAIFPAFPPSVVYCAHDLR